MTRLDALADPVRLSVARHLAANPDVTAPEVAASVGVHLNTARAHLSALTDAGVVQRRSERSGNRGRPIVRYRLRHRWAPRGDELLPLAALLGSAVRGAGIRERELRELGRRWGQGRSERGRSGSGGTQVVAELERLGFRAKVRGNRLDLSSCPCPLVAPDRPSVVCDLARGVADGVLEESGLRVRSGAHDPASRHCVLTLSAA
jgi:predicted ArsR family transcriptional regulator